MKNRVIKATSIAIISLTTIAMINGLKVAYADDDSANMESAESESVDVGTSIGISPVTNMLNLSSNSEYNDTVEVKNEGNTAMDIELYAAPYSYVYSEDENIYKLGFNNENNFTQITRWITFRDKEGHWKKNVTYTIEPGDTLIADYKVATPDNIPAGGQYAVIFAHTLTPVTSASGVKTEASPGMIIYGHSTEGEAIVSAGISGLEIKESVTDNETTRDNLFAYAKVKNTGNVDFGAKGVLKVEPILWGPSYETPDGQGLASVIPESELAVSDEWEDSPSFGIFKATWTVSAGDQTEVIEKIIFINPFPIIFITIILLTIIIMSIIIVVRKRKERRARLAI